MKVLLSWLREFVDVAGTPEEIGARMSMRGLALEGIEARADGDAVLDFEVTANRPDCLSIVGIAREIATAFSLPLNTQARPHTADGAGGMTMRAISDTLPVTIEEPELCARYVAAIADVAIDPSPEWMRSRLEASGVRPINNVVDVTNYVLLELGHPMHAFDFERLAGPAIVVRRARAGEQLQTLDGKTRTLTVDMLVIADAERASAIGGVMGGAASEVSASTRRIVLESAWFKPQSVRATSKRLGLRTEASYRFERGADLLAAPIAMRRALSLLSEIGAARGYGALIDVYPREHQATELTLDAHAIHGLLGMDVPSIEVDRILRSLGFEVNPLGGWQAAAPDLAMPIGAVGHGWRVGVPSWRVDIQRPVDLIEEVGRHHGFENLPTTFPSVEEAPGPSDPRITRDGKVRRALLGMGFSEAIAFAFIETGAAAQFLDGQAPVSLANPLSEKFTTLRPSLISGLVDAVSHNRRHGRRDVRLFEIGTRFSPHGETRAAAVAWTGLATPDHWGTERRDVDFFDVKGAAETICSVLGIEPTVGAATAPYLVEGRRAQLSIDGHVVGVVGQLDPVIADSRDLPASDAVYVVEIDLDAVTARVASTPRFAKPLPRHPAVTRDLAILIDDSLSADTVRGTIRSANAANVIDLREFDRYQGKGIPDGKVSLALRLTFQAPDRTLTDAEVQSSMQRIVDALKRDLGAIQR